MPTPPHLPPGPSSRIPGKVFRELRQNPLNFLTKYAQIHGDIFSFSAFNQRYIVLNHPDLIKEVLLTQADAFWKGPALQNSKGILGNGLLTAEGDSHKQQRRLMTPAFHAKFVESYADKVLDSARLLIAHWKSAPAHPPRDIRPHMMKLTLQIAGTALFGTLLTDQTNLVYHAMETLLANFNRSVVPWGKLLNHLPLPSTRKLKKAQHDLHSLIQTIIQTRHQQTQSSVLSPQSSVDLLSTLIAATDPESTVKLTDQQLADQAITILTAGHETTANAMTFTLYLLASHPHIQSQLAAQITAALAQNPLTPDLLNQLPLIRHVLAESMRLLPPVWTIGRQNQRPLTLANHLIPNKSTVLAPQWLLHRDPRWFPNPLDFNPLRWQAPTHPRYAYFPFSTGPRNCIGEAFAWLEMSLALALLIQNFHFSLPANTPSPLPLTPSITLRPKTPLPLKITPRPV